jgi:hypothetical protein
MTTTTMWSGLGSAVTGELAAELLGVLDDVEGLVAAGDDVSRCGWSLLVQAAKTARTARAAANRAGVRTTPTLARVPDIPRDGISLCDIPSTDTDEGYQWQTIGGSTRPYLS